jgi:hypothetical protein
MNGRLFLGKRLLQFKLEWPGIDCEENAAALDPLIVTDLHGLNRASDLRRYLDNIRVYVGIVSVGDDIA